MKTKFVPILLFSILLLAACSTATTQAPALSPTQAQPAYPPASNANPGSSESPTTPTGEVSINISGFKFDPATVTVKVGTTITWTNQDTATHTVKADDGSWSSDSLKKGDIFSQTFTQTGTFTYICGIHPSMAGTVVVEP